MKNHNYHLKVEGYVWFALFVASIFAANYFIRHVGTECFGTPDSQVCTIPVPPFDLTAPSGVLFVGLSFTFRDLVQRRLGLRYAWAAVGIGALLSGLLDPALALASAAAFLLAEGMDLMVYTPLQRRNLFWAVIASNAVGVFVDSAVFLLLAGIPMAFITGQVVGKFYMTFAALPVVWAIRKWDTSRGLKADRNGQTVWTEPAAGD